MKSRFFPMILGSVGLLGLVACSKSTAMKGSVPSLISGSSTAEAEVIKKGADSANGQTVTTDGSGRGSRVSDGLQTSDQKLCTASVEEHLGGNGGNATADAVGRDQQGAEGSGGEIDGTGSGEGDLVRERCRERIRDSEVAGSEG